VTVLLRQHCRAVTAFFLLASAYRPLYASANRRLRSHSAREDTMTARIPLRLPSVIVGTLTAVAALLLLSGGAAAQKTTLTVYTAIEADDLKKYQTRFNEDVPDIEIKWVRDSTGIVTAKLLAEKANPQADVIWGLAATSLLVLKPEGMLLPYAPKGLDRLDAQFRDKDNPPAWVGMDAWVAAICFNTVEGQKKNLPKPASWKDLTKPVYKGQIVMPNPASSGTGFLDVSSWLQIFGEAEGWKYMDALHENIAVYTHSGSKPCTMAGSGEYPVGISFEFRAARMKKQGAPLDIVFPSEGSGWDMEATAIVKGTKNLETAKKFVDWTITDKALKLYNEGYAIVAIAKMSQPIEFLPTNMLEHMAKNDFQWAATNRARILAEWQKRYDTKSEPKK
jgi:iron(III) transport system substrate-binding protein